MNMRILLTTSAMLVMPLGGLAADALTSLHPEEAYPDNTRQVSPDRYTDLNKRVQEKLHALGFDAGPVNGEFDGKTQAALAQFQLSAALPASGQLDDRTLAELGVERDTQASATSLEEAAADRWWQPSAGSSGREARSAPGARD